MSFGILPILNVECSWPDQSIRGQCFLISIYELNEELQSRLQSKAAEDAKLVILDPYGLVVEGPLKSEL